MFRIILALHSLGEVAFWAVTVEADFFGEKSEVRSIEGGPRSADHWSLTNPSTRLTLVTAHRRLFRT